MGNDVNIKEEGYIMIGKNMKKLIIVCDDKTEKYANILRQLISANDDTDGEIRGIEDGTVDVVVWKEKDYIDNMAVISSKERILFLGENKVSKNEFNSSMKLYFDYCGMMYGWLGNRGVMRVTRSIEEEEYNEFVELYQTHGLEFEKVDFGKTLTDAVEDSREKTKGLFAKNSLLSTITNKVTSVADIVGVGKTIVSINRQSLITQQQFHTLVTVFYREGLANFLRN